MVLFYSLPMISDFNYIPRRTIPISFLPAQFKSEKHFVLDTFHGEHCSTSLSLTMDFLMRS